MSIWESPGANKSNHLGRPAVDKTCEKVELNSDDLLMIGVDMQMIHADIYGDAEKRFRPCQNCHEDFRYKSEDDWLCTVCRGQRAEMERRQGVEGDLLNANKVMK